MKCDHSDKSLWIGKADGIYCKECGEKIEPGKPAKKAPAKKVIAEEPAAEPEKKAPAKKAPAKKATTGRAKK